jgi:phosphoglycerate dehydrogenase-like enzyme
MPSRKSYLLIGRLPSSALFTSIQANHDVTHISAKQFTRAEMIEKIASLPQKSFTFVLLLRDAQHLYPIDKTLIGPLSIECFVKVGAGFDSIDVGYFTSRGAWVANAPNAVRIPTAEWSVALILATVKGLGIADTSVRQGKWRQGLGLQSNITGMTLGIIGLGAIGKVSSIRDQI